MMSCSVAARSGSAAAAGWRLALDVTLVRILTNVAEPVNCRHARSASTRQQAHAADLNVARATTAGYGQSSQFLDLLAEDSRLNVYAGELEVRPPDAPTSSALAVVGQVADSFVRRVAPQEPGRVHGC